MYTEYQHTWGFNFTEFPCLLYNPSLQLNGLPRLLFFLHFMFNIKIALIKIINAKLETFKKHSIKSFLINIAFVIERLLSKK